MFTAPQRGDVIKLAPNFCVAEFDIRYATSNSLICLITRLEFTDATDSTGMSKLKALKYSGILPGRFRWCNKKR